jgi:transposase
VERSSNDFEQHSLEIWYRCSLEDIPERYGSWKTSYYRFTRWQKDGTWDHLLTFVQTYSYAVSDIDWTVFVDSTIVRTHQHAEAEVGQ